MTRFDAGGVLQAIAFPFRTGPVGNGIAIWLGIEPADLFLYIFLPPMLVDAAVRIDFFIFRKVGNVSLQHGCSPLNGTAPILRRAVTMMRHLNPTTAACTLMQLASSR